MGRSLGGVRLMSWNRFVEYELSIQKMSHYRLCELKNQLKVERKTNLDLTDLVHRLIVENSELKNK